MRIFLSIITGLLFLSPSLGATEPKLTGASDLNELGIKYTLKKSTDPILNKIHVLRINLALNK